MTETEHVASYAPAPPRFELVPFDQISMPRGRHYLVKGLIPRSGLVVVWGPRKCGKSFWTTDVALHIALGWTYRGRRVQQGPVAYVSCEGNDQIGRRIEAFRRARLCEDTEPVPFYLVPSRLDLIAEHETLAGDIRQQLGEARPALVVIDTLNRSLNGSESSDEDMGAYVRAADAVKDAFNCAVVVVHHCGNDSTRPRGHTSLSGAADAQIAVKLMADEIIHATLEFMKDGRAGDEFYSLLEDVDLGPDDDGDEQFSKVVTPADNHGVGHGRARPTGAARRVYELLNKAIAEAGEIPPASNHIPRDIPAVRTSLWRAYCEKGQVSSSDKPDTQRKAFNRAANKLQDGGFVGVWDDWAWMADRTGHAGT